MLFKFCSNIDNVDSDAFFFVRPRFASSRKKNETDEIHGNEKEERGKKSYIWYAQHASCCKVTQRIVVTLSSI